MCVMGSFAPLVYTEYNFDGRIDQYKNTDTRFCCQEPKLSSMAENCSKIDGSISTIWYKSSMGILDSGDKRRNYGFYWQVGWPVIDPHQLLPLMRKGTMGY